MEKIQQAIEKFIKGGDHNDTAVLEEVLHKDYQNIQDGFFDQPGIFVIRKEEYIRLVREKIFGGKPRKITFHFIEHTNNTAYAKISMESPVLKFSSLITCVQENEKWQIIINIPSIESK